MKIKWTVEGAGCNYRQCGLRDFIIDIPDGELDGMTEAQREAMIFELVQGEFDQNVYPSWEVIHDPESS